MLRSVASLYQYRLDTTDGEMGTIIDLLFDDQSWKIRFFLIDTGEWLPGKQVLISPILISGKPDWRTQRVPVRLTRNEVEDSPSIDEHKPVSRQRESERTRIQMTASIYWGASRRMYRDVSSKTAPGAPHEFRDPQLRSCREIHAYSIVAKDGTAGSVDDFIVEHEGWKLQYIVVDTRGWLTSRKVLIAPGWVEEVRWSHRSVSVDLRKEQLDESPAYDPSETINREFETRLYDYYGRPRYWLDDISLST